MDTSNDFKDLIKIGIANGQYPQFVYKYRVSDTKKNPYFDNIIVDNSMMFSSPTNFNDPFDCQIPPVTNPTKKELLDFLTRVMIGVPASTIKSLADNTLKDPDGFAKILKNTVKFDDSGVLCLSQEVDNILLWSHYADNHCGVCLKFDMLEDLDFFTVPFHVIYDKKYPVYNHLTQSDKLVNMMLRTKFKVWEYEREIRVIKMKNGVYQFNKKALTEILFGCNVSTTEIDRITNLALTNGYGHISFKKAEKQVGKYGVSFNPI